MKIVVNGGNETMTDWLKRDRSQYYLVMVGSSLVYLSILIFFLLVDLTQEFVLFIPFFTLMFVGILPVYHGANSVMSKAVGYQISVCNEKDEVHLGSINEKHWPTTKLVIPRLQLAASIGNIPYGEKNFPKQCLILGDDKNKIYFPLAFFDVEQIIEDLNITDVEVPRNSPSTLSS